MFVLSCYYHHTKMGLLLATVRYTLRETHSGSGGGGGHPDVPECNAITRLKVKN